MPSSAMHPTSAPLFHVLQTLLLLRGENRRDLAVGFGNCFADATTSVASNFFELRARFFDDRRNLGHLFVGEPKLPSQTVFHRLSNKPVRIWSEHEMVSNRHGQEYAGGAASDKHEQASGDQFPFQRATHCATSS